MTKHFRMVSHQQWLWRKWFCWCTVLWMYVSNLEVGNKCLHVFFVCRQALHISTAYFTMVLLDEYGVDRERFVNPTTSDELYSYVEEYLLNEEERERLELNKDFCDWSRSDQIQICVVHGDVVGGSFPYCGRSLGCMHPQSLFPRQTVIWNYIL